MAGNTQEYKEMFVEEAREHLQTLNQSLLDFEKDPKNKDALNKIFRAAHTIKGMSATLNYDKIQKLSHKTEDTLDLIRNNKLEVNPQIIDLIFKCFDGIEKMVEDIAAQDMTEYDIQGLIAELEKHTQTNPVPQTTDHQQKPQPQKPSETTISLDQTFQQQIITELKNGKYAYKISITVDKTCSMKSIRAFLLLKKLSDEGKIVTSKPDRQQIENGLFDDSFEVYYTSNENPDAVQRIVNSVSELAVKTVTPLSYTNDSLQVIPPEKSQEKIEQQPAPLHQATFQLGQDQTVKKTEEKTKTQTQTTVQTIRIGMDQLDKFMNLIGELVISKGRLAQIAADHKLEDLSETIDTIDRLTTELQDKILQIRMIPMKHVFDRFPRMIRDLARDNGKKVNLIITGEGIELDRTILDEIGDPLVHLLRNSIDHGIEPPEIRRQSGKPEEGTVELLAERTRNHVVITVRDDGKGIDPNAMRKAAVKKGLKTQEEVDQLDDKEALNLMFLPGLSTAEKITNISGRGVGMDVVKSTIERLNGSVEIYSELGKGSAFLLRLPLTLAIFKALFVGVGQETYAIPINNVSETINLNPQDIQYLNGRPAILLRNDILPLVSMTNILNVPREQQTKTTMYGVVVQKEDKKIGLIVDRLIGEQEITIKNISTSLKKTKGIAGVTITGDGRVILVIDVNTLID
ncbi:MAG: chemotaxis protein CheA [Candidatus Thermoplasmatota archaeon]